MYIVRTMKRDNEKMYVLLTSKRKYEEFVVIEEPTTTLRSLSPITKPQYKLYVSNEITTEGIDIHRDEKPPSKKGPISLRPSSKHRIKRDSHFLRRATTQITRAMPKTEHLNSNHLSSKVPHSR